MDSTQLIRQFLEQGRIMQLATSDEQSPWACSVHYCSDNDLNIYWISTEARVHSRHIAQNPNVAATVMVHEDTPNEPYVIGLSIAGSAKLLTEQETDAVQAIYRVKTGKSEELMNELMSEPNAHKFYRLVPNKVVLFDNKNFPEDPRQEVAL